MFPDNDFYGHADILRRFAGVRGHPSVPGRLQHGWQPGPGLSTRHLAEPWPKYLWSNRNLARASEAGFRGLVPLGAPYLYLPDAPDDASGARGLLAIPFHGWEKQQISGDFRAYADSLEILVARGFGPVTVCLYFTEHRDPALRRVFEERGHAVVTMGPRDGNPDFLVRQRTLLRAHARVTSNRVSTAAFYALHERRPFFVHGPTTGLAASEDPDGERFAAFQRATFPTLCDAGAGSQADVAVAAAELGTAHRRSPEELRALLAWTPGRVFVRVARRFARVSHGIRTALRGGA
jgi:hypothetical protein